MNKTIFNFLLWTTIILFVLGGCSEPDGGVSPTNEQPDTLMTLTIPENYNTFDTEWIFLSDANGNPLGKPQQVLNNSKLIFPAVDGFNGETFFVSIFSYYSPALESGRYKSRVVYTYTDVARGNYHFKKIASPSSGTPGTFTASVNNVPDNYQNGFSLGGNTSGFESSVDWNGIGTITGDLNGTPEDVLLVFEDDNGDVSYKILQDVPDGGNYTLDFTDFAAMTSDVLAVEGVTSKSVMQRGYREGSDVSYLYKLDVNTTPIEKFVICHPTDNVFSSILTSLSWRVGDVTYSYTSHATTTPTELKEADADLTSHNFLNGNIDLTFSATGSRVAIAATEQHSDQDTLFMTDWYFQSAFKNSIQFKRPQLPSELVAHYYFEGFQDPPVTSVTVYQNNDGEDYNQSLQQMFNGAPAHDPLSNFEKLAKIFKITSQGGRSQTSPERLFEVPFDVAHYSDWRQESSLK